VTKFAQTSIFSALNNLKDLTLDPNYAAICGFTIGEFDALFSEHIKTMLESLKADGNLPPEATVSDLRQSILDWYDGYAWDGQTKVLNPWSILYAFDNNRFGNYWYQSGGVPNFLKGLVKAGKIDFSAFKPEESVSDMENVIELGTEFEPVPVLFQSGYLTVERVDKSTDIAEFFLKIPNLEVRACLVALLLSLKPFKDPLTSKKQAQSMVKALIKRDAEGFQDSFDSYLSAFPYSSHIDDEKHYRMQFWSAMIMAGENIEMEIAARGGIVDARYKAPDGVFYVFEIKYLAPEKTKKGKLIPITEAKMRARAKVAMKQIEGKKYTKGLKNAGNVIYKVALVVGGRTDVLVEFKKDTDQGKAALKKAPKKATKKG
jgi:hypothetical protein